MLWDREELAARNGGRAVQANEQVYDGTAERLATFRGGLPVELPAWAVPDVARGGERKEALTWRRAVVHPDGSVEIRVATRQEVLDDLGV